MEKSGYVFLILAQFLTMSSGWLWYTPVSKDQTIADCQKMKINKSPFYPSYCDGLLNKITGNIIGTSAGYDHKNNHYETTAYPDHTNIRPLVTNGWGWSHWTEWMNDACPEFCGRRCRSRTRYCAGPFHISCSGHGSEYDNCPGKMGSTYYWSIDDEDDGYKEPDRPDPGYTSPDDAIDDSGRFDIPENPRRRPPTSLTTSNERRRDRRRRRLRRPIKSVEKLKT